MKFDWIIEYDFKTKKAIKRPYESEDVHEVFVPKFIGKKILLPGVGDDVGLIYQKKTLLEKSMEQLQAYQTEYLYLNLWRLFLDSKELTKDEKMSLHKVGKMSIDVQKLKAKYPNTFEITLLPYLNRNELIVYNGIQELIILLNNY